MKRTFLLVSVLAALTITIGALAEQAAHSVPLQLVAKIPLGEVKGRIDHMAVDLAGRRLFVAELGNGSVGVVDLSTLQVSGRIRGLKEPQGVGYLPSTDTVYVASAGDGSVRMYRGRDLEEAAHIQLGEDADNIRVDSAGNRVFVGYGQGWLAVIDAGQIRNLSDVALHGHPEGFQLGNGGDRIFVNVPDAHAVEVVDRQRGEVVARWKTGPAGENFPMALAEASGQILVAFRAPAMLSAFSMVDGARVKDARTCRDADDLFVDAKRHRVYVSCGDAHLDVFELKDGSFRRMARLPTAHGARTSLFVPELDRLFLAVRARAGEKAAIWVYRPSP
jgi:YVTN family beta-propeller protein